MIEPLRLLLVAVLGCSLRFDDCMIDLKKAAVKWVILFSH